jgi:hypothetical protein
MKGKYRISIYQPGTSFPGGNWNDFIAPCSVYLDGVRTRYDYKTAATGGFAGIQIIAEANFLTTAEHTITLKNLAEGTLAWDYVRFDPIK